jgi:flavin-dependent dehydrogenase
MDAVAGRRRAGLSVDRCDVLIVGGGPAGSSCAWTLRRSGLDVVILDRKAFPRDKVCAGWITPAVLEALEIVEQDYRKQRVLQPIRGFRVGALGGRSVPIDFGRVVSFAIRRCEFDHHLLARCDARKRLAEPLDSLRRENGRWIANDSIDAGLVVGAGGHFCPVARQLAGSAARVEPIVSAQEIEFELDAREQAACDVAPELPELYFAPDCKGYAWVVRKQAFVNVGLGRQDSHELAGHVRRFVALLESEGKLPRGERPRFRGHAYTLYGQTPRPLCADGALLVGDAAGLAYPRSGEGIRPAVESGILAGRAIVAAEGNYTMKSLSSYASALTARLGRRGDAPGAGLSDFLPAALRPAFARRLLGNRWFARHVVLDRWFLHRSDAPLAPAQP